MAIDLDGKVVLITGAAVGIGRSSARIFARGGAKLILVDILDEDGEETAAQVRESGGQAEYFRCDVTQADEVENLINLVVDKYGRLDCAFNNAGFEGQVASTAECSEENWDHVLAVNLKGVWLCMKNEIRQMFLQRSGVIVNTASVAGVIAEEGFPAYAAAKGGVVQLTKTAAVEYASSGIRINAVCPGVIRTPMVDRALEGVRMENMAPGAIRSPVIRYVANRIIQSKSVRKGMQKMMQPMGRIGEPEEVAEAAMWLCSDAASFVTGHCLLIDGGMTVT